VSTSDSKASVCVRYVIGSVMYLKSGIISSRADLVSNGSTHAFDMMANADILSLSTKWSMIYPLILGAEVKSRKNRT
jgi:hypothetical protein